MPELPEVETVARTLAPQVEGQRITSVQIFNESSVDGDRIAFNALAGRTVTRVHRRGKLLLMDLDSAKPNACGEIATQIGVHLKMSGKLFIYAPDTPPNKHTRVIFDLASGNRLFFDDTRKFGYCRAVVPSDAEGWKFLRTLGPEPLEISEAQFVALFKDRRTRMKAALLDQTVIAGVGNIYADESLFRAGIRPDTIANTVSTKKLKLLYSELQAILELAIRECGSSIRDYRNANGDAGAFQNNFRVYGRGGEKCVKCDKPLATAKVAGRTTVFCRKCQK